MRNHRAIAAEASVSFTMRACGSLDRPVPGSHTKPKLFVQNDKSDVRYTMKGLVADDGSANYYFMEGRFDPDKNYNNRQSVTTAYFGAKLPPISVQSYH